MREATSPSFNSNITLIYLYAICFYCNWRKLIKKFESYLIANLSKETDARAHELS